MSRAESAAACVDSPLWRQHVAVRGKRLFCRTSHCFDCHADGFDTASAQWSPIIIMLSCGHWCLGRSREGTVALAQLLVSTPFRIFVIVAPSCERRPWPLRLICDDTLGQRRIMIDAS